MFTKRDLEGYLCVDHTESPEAFGVAAGTKLQARVYTCCGCTAMVVVDGAGGPEYCSKCDRYMCKRCALVRKVTGYHKPWKVVVAEVLAKGAMRNG